PELDRICLKALERDPAVRYAHAADLARDLATFASAAQPGLTREDVAAWVRELVPLAAPTLPVDAAATTVATPFSTGAPRGYLGSSPASPPGPSELPATSRSKRPRPRVLGRGLVAFAGVSGAALCAALYYAVRSPDRSSDPVPVPAAVPTDVADACDGCTA